MLKIVAVLVLLGAAGGGLYAYWDVLVPRANTVVAGQGSPSRLLGARVPGFYLPGLLGEGFAARDLITGRQPRLVKFWGSWSPACILEHPVLMELQASRVEVWSIVFRDTRTNALDYLERNGNPYARVAFDAAGRAASDWGVKEVPATFLVDGEGIVRWHHSGPLTPRIVASQVRPLLERYAP